MPVSEGSPQSMRIGDTVFLYAVESKGYVFSELVSDVLEQCVEGLPFGTVQVSLVPRPSVPRPVGKLEMEKLEGGSGKPAYYCVQLRWNVSGAN